MKKCSVVFAFLFVLVFGLLPGVAFAADDSGLWVGGVEVTSSNASNIKGSGLSGKISYSASTNTLTLNNATISSVHEVDSYYYASGDPVPFLRKTAYGIHQSASGAFTVKLVGTNKLNFSYDGKSDSIAVAFGKQNGKLIFSGSGSLAISSKCGCYSKGINCIELTVNSGATVKSSITAKDDMCYAVYSDGPITVAGTLSGSAVNSGSSDSAIGVDANSNLSVKKGGKLTASAQGSSYVGSLAFGAECGEKLSVAGTLTSSAKGTSAYSLTLDKGGSVAKGGKLNVSAETTWREDTTALCLESGNLTINGTAKVTSNAKGAVCESDSGATVTVGSTGELIVSGNPAFEKIAVKLGSKALKTLVGFSSSGAKASSPSKIGDSHYVRIYTPKTNPMTVKAKKVTFKASDLKKKSRSKKAKKAFTVKKAKGKVTYKVTKYKTKAAKGKIKVAKNGKVTVKKGTPKKTYKLKVKVTAAGNATYKSKSKTVTLKVKVK